MIRTRRGGFVRWHDDRTGAGHRDCADGTRSARAGARVLGILYAPDYCANAGGIIFLVEERAGRAGPAGHRIAAIGDTLTRIWQRARREHVPPEQVAEAIATERLAAARAAGAAAGAAARSIGRGAGR